MPTDKDGKKLQLGSIISTCKPGRKNYTIRGVVTELNEEHVVMFDFRKLFTRSLSYENVKRIRYKGKPDETYVNF